MSPTITIATLLLIFLLIFLFSQKTDKKACQLKDWTDVNTGWSQCTPDCGSGVQTRLKKQIISDPSGDCPKDIETRPCTCQIVLGNGVIEVNKDYEYKDFIDLAGNIDNVTVPPNTKILIETIDNKTYVVLGDKIPLTGLKNFLQRINHNSSINTLKLQS